MNPSSEEILERAFHRLKEGSFEEAEEAFTNYLLIEPRDPKPYSGRGTARFQLKNWAAAVLDFKKAKELDPEDLENWIGLAMSLAMENKIYEAIETFEVLLSKHPHFVRAHIQLGQLYYRLGIIKKGHTHMDLALLSRPNLAERRMVEQVKKEQLQMDKKRIYRPDFEALRKQKASSPPPAWLKKITDFFRRKSR